MPASTPHRVLGLGVWLGCTLSQTLRPRPDASLLDLEAEGIVALVASLSTYVGSQGYCVKRLAVLHHFSALALAFFSWRSPALVGPHHEGLARHKGSTVG